MKSMTACAALAVAGGALALSPAAARAQGAQNHFLAVGDTAPDIQLTGATRYGILKDPIHLRDFRGETVVLAFYFKARTPG